MDVEVEMEEGDGVVVMNPEDITITTVAKNEAVEVEEAEIEVLVDRGVKTRDSPLPMAFFEDCSDEYFFLCFTYISVIYLRIINLSFAACDLILIVSLSPSWPVYIHVPSATYSIFHLAFLTASKVSAENPCRNRN